MVVVVVVVVMVVVMVGVAVVAGAVSEQTVFRFVSRFSPQACTRWMLTVRSLFLASCNIAGKMKGTCCKPRLFNPPCEEHFVFVLRGVLGVETGISDAEGVVGCSENQIKSQIPSCRSD